MAVTKSKCYFDGKTYYISNNVELNIPNAIKVEYNAWYFPRKKSIKKFNEKHYINGSLAYELDNDNSQYYYYITLNQHKLFSSIKTLYKCYNNDMYKFCEIDESIYNNYHALHIY